MSKSIILTFDVEEWFHTTFMYEYLTSRDIAQSRIYESLQTCLDLLNEHDIAATFFCSSRTCRKESENNKHDYRCQSSARDCITFI